MNSVRRFVACRIARVALAFSGAAASIGEIGYAVLPAEDRECDNLLQLADLARKEEFEARFT